MKLRATYAPPPIPDRNYDWSVVDSDTYDGAEDSRNRHHIGYGRSKEAAIADWHLQAAELRPEPERVLTEAEEREQTMYDRLHPQQW